MMQEVQIPQGLQHPEHPGFVDARKPYNCAQCIRWHGDRLGFPDLDPENGEAWGLYNRLQSQVRIGMDVVGLDYTVLPVAFDLYQILDAERVEVFEKLMVIDHEAMEERARQRERDKRKREMEANR